MEDDSEVELDDEAAEIDLPGAGACGEPVGDDPLPEYCRYRDEGCELSNSCLNCPFPRCIYDVPGGMQHYEKDKAAREIIFQHGRGLTAKQIARIVNDSVRKVQRVIREFKRDTNIVTENERETWYE
jgi:hypothetical protein